MSRSRSHQISTVAFAGVAVVAGALVVPATEASAQAGRGTMSVPRAGRTCD